MIPANTKSETGAYVFPVVRCVVMHDLGKFILLSLGLAAAHVFHLLWTSQFFFYLGYLIFAGAAADWYFCKVDEKGTTTTRKKTNLLHWIE